MAWDRTEPAANSALQSADLRNNWAALDNSLSGVNLLGDPTFLIWPAGDAASPAYWTASGTGNAVARTGTGLTDTSRKIGAFAAKLTSGSATGKLTQDLLPTGTYDDGFDGLIVVGGAWVKSSNATSVRLQFDDGASSSTSSDHTGGGTFEWLTLTHTISGTATKLAFELVVDATGNVGIISGATALLGQVPPQGYVPPATRQYTIPLALTGDPPLNDPPTGNNLARYVFDRPAIVKHVQVVVGSIPGTNHYVVDVEQRGSAWNSMYSAGGPSVSSTGERTDGAAPDGTYQYRCFTGGFGPGANAPADYTTLRVNQTGSAPTTGTAEGAMVLLRVLQFDRPLENFLAFDDVN